MSVDLRFALDWFVFTPILLAIAVFLAVSCPGTLQGAEPASVSGQFLWQGAIPEPDELPTLSIDPRTQGLAGIFVYAISGVASEPRSTGTSMSVRLSDRRGYEPRMLAITPFDTIAVTVVDRGAPTTIALSRNGQTPRQKRPGEYLIDFPSPATLPQPLLCAVNEKAVCHVLVLEHRHVAITDEQGRFCLPSLPAGRIILQAWHEQIGYVKAWGKQRERAHAVNLREGESQELDLTPVDRSMLIDASGRR